MFSVLDGGIEFLVNIIIRKNSASLAASQVPTFQGINLYTWILIALAFILTIAGIYFLRIYLLRIYCSFIQYISSSIKALKTMVRGTGIIRVTGNDELDKAIEIAGYSYDLKQDIFYSSMDAW